MTISFTSPGRGYAWRVADSKRLDLRLTDVVGRMRAAQGLSHQRASDIAARAAALPADWLEHEERRVQEEFRASRTAVLLARLDPLYRNAVPRHEATHRWLAAYRLGDPSNLIIFGATGVGKTWEANALARLLLVEDTVPVTVTTVAAMIDAMKPSSDGPADDGQFKVTPVLIMDDLGAERLTEFAADRLIDVMDYRTRKQLPTVVTTNLTAEQIKARYDPRLVRRLGEGARRVDITTNAHRPPSVL